LTRGRRTAVEPGATDAYTDHEKAFDECRRTGEVERIEDHRSER
jgi:hypothetical protein